MKRTAAVFAGGTLFSALLACVAHDDTNSANPPQPGDAAFPIRTVVDSGLVTFSDDDGGGVPVGGDAEEITPDARARPDSSPDLATAELGGIGSFCDLFGKNVTYCGTKNGCYPSLANGTGTCQAQQGRTLDPGINCDPAAPLCGPQLICNSSSVCANLCHYGASASVLNADCGGSIGGQCIKWSDTVGYCN
jgi:hypothetical protein